MNNTLNSELWLPIASSVYDVFSIFVIPEFVAWVSNHIHKKQWDVMTHPRPFLNGGLTQQPLKFGTDEYM